MNIQEQIATLQTRIDTEADAVVKNALRMQVAALQAKAKAAEAKTNRTTTRTNKAGQSVTLKVGDDLFQPWHGTTTARIVRRRIVAVSPTGAIAFRTDYKGKAEYDNDIVVLDEENRDGRGWRRERWYVTADEAQANLFASCDASVKSAEKRVREARALALAVANATLAFDDHGRFDIEVPDEDDEN